MIESFDKMLKGQNDEKMKAIAEKQISKNNVRLQNSLVESIFETDKLECRQRYKNLRISGLEPAENEPLKASSVIRYCAASHGVSSQWYQTQITATR